MYQSLESDVPNPKAGLHVTFFPGKIENNARARDTGKPEYDLVDFIRINVPGNMLNVIERPVTPADKQDYPTQWQAYKNASEYRPESGTPIEDWPRVDVATAARLKAMGFHTVEQIADASDAMCQNIGMGCFELRTKAIAYVKSAKDSAYAQKQAEELADRDLQIADLKAANQSLAERLVALERDASEKMTGAEKRGPGRPPKVQSESLAG